MTFRHGYDSYQVIWSLIWRISGLIYPYAVDIIVPSVLIIRVCGNQHKTFSIITMMVNNDFCGKIIFLLNFVTFLTFDYYTLFINF